jgi:hypothetical protein
MRKIILGLVVLCLGASANAQSTEFKPFKVDLAFGYAVPGGSGSKGGALFAIEPKYAINDNITVGVRMEGAVMARASQSSTGEPLVADVKASGSYLATGDYYFNTNQFRPFAGIGLGIYSNAGASVDSYGGTSDVSTGTKFGGAPRVGFEYGHFRMAVEYNLVGKSAGINYNYLGVKLGFFIGGGRIGN